MQKDWFDRSPRVYVLRPIVSEPVSARDLDRISADLDRLRVLLDDPIALIARVEQLLTGTAERLI